MFVSSSTIYKWIFEILHSEIWIPKALISNLDRLPLVISFGNQTQARRISTTIQLSLSNISVGNTTPNEYHPNDPSKFSPTLVEEWRGGG